LDSTRSNPRGALPIADYTDASRRPGSTGRARRPHPGAGIQAPRRSHHHSPRLDSVHSMGSVDATGGQATTRPIPRHQPAPAGRPAGRRQKWPDQAGHTPISHTGGTVHELPGMLNSRIVGRPESHRRLLRLLRCRCLPWPPAWPVSKPATTTSDKQPHNRTLSPSYTTLSLDNLDHHRVAFTASSRAIRSLPDLSGRTAHHVT
jgi:hypothetical protein